MLPQKYESQVYQSGISSEYLELSNRASELLLPNVMTSSELDYKNIGVLKKYKIGDFELELPVGDPLIKIRPIISLVGKKLIYGLSFHDYSEGKVLSISYNGKKKFSLPKLEDKIFQLAIAKDVLYEKSKTKIYNDLFGLGIIHHEKSYFDFIISPELNLKRPIYNFFLLKNRLRYGISNNSFFIKDRNLYGTTVEENGTVSEFIEIYQNGMIYFFKIEHSGWKGMGKSLRNLILKTLSKVDVEEAYITEIYNNFLRNTFEDRSKEKNILMLFSAWSLNFSDKRFLKALIQTIERSKNFSSELLNSLYLYSSTIHGETFSSRDDIKKKLDSAGAKIRQGENSENKNSDNTSELDSYRIDFEKIKSGKDYLESNIEIKKNELIDE